MSLDQSTFFPSGNISQALRRHSERDHGTWRSRNGADKIKRQGHSLDNVHSTDATLKVASLTLTMEEILGSAAAGGPQEVPVPAAPVVIPPV